MLRLERLSKIFGPQAATAIASLRAGTSKAELFESSGHSVGVFDATLHIERGELFVIMGLSGSGKSTLLRMINRLIEPSAGQVFFAGDEVTAMSARELVELRRQHMSMVFQSFALMPHLSVIDNVAFGLRMRGTDKATARRTAQQALELVGIAEVAQQRPEQLSGGMQQRVGLARAWVTNPEVMLMDEAFSALDPLIRTEMQDALLELQHNAKRTIVFVSHDLTEALRIADRLAIMADGEIRQIGTPTDIIQNPADDYVRAFVRDAQPGRIFTAGDIAVSGISTNTQNPIAADTLLHDCLPAVAAHETPLPVADAGGNIIGHISHQQLLKALANGRSL